MKHDAETETIEPQDAIPDLDAGPMNIELMIYRDMEPLTRESVQQLWHDRRTIGTPPHNFTTWIPDRYDSRFEYRVSLMNIVRAEPGWFMGETQICDSNGFPIGMWSPLRFYGRKHDVPTLHHFMPHEKWVQGAGGQWHIEGHETLSLSVRTVS